MIGTESPAALSNCDRLRPRSLVMGLVTEVTFCLPSEVVWIDGAELDPIVDGDGHRFET